MTTPVHPPKRTGRVLTGAALWLVVASAVLAVVGGLTQGDRAVYGVLLGAGLVLLVFTFGATVVGATAKVLPNAVLLVALLTYTLQLMLLGLVYVGFRESPEAQREISQDWLAGGMIAATLAWMAGQVFVTVRTPIEPWVAPVEDAAEPTAGVGRRLTDDPR